jgi:hypothetical protein
MRVEDTAHCDRPLSFAPPRRNVRLVFRLVIWKVRLGLPGSFRAFGTSMTPVIRSGTRVTLEPVDVDRLELGDIVAARVGDSTMLHLVKALDGERRQVEISGTSGPANGWTPFELVYGICTRIGETTVPGAAEKVRRFALGRKIGRRLYVVER